MEINAERFNEVLNSHGMTPYSASIRIGSSPSTLSTSIRLGRISSTTLSRLPLIGISEEEIESIKSVHDISVYKRDEKEETSSNTVSITNVSEQEMKDFMVYMKTIQELLYINNQLLKQILETWNK